MKNTQAVQIPTKLFVGNILSAFTLAMTDKVETAICDATGQSASACYAIVQIGTEPDSSIEELRRILGLEHSSVVRLIDRLERSGLASRDRGKTEDRRQVTITLTESGEAEFTKILNARAEIIDKVISDLSEEEMKTLEGLVQRLMPKVTEIGYDQHIVCRLCELEVCPQEKCPVNLAHPGNEDFPEKPFRRKHDSRFA